MGIDKARIAARKALERMYQGRATVIEYQKVKDEYGMTNFQEVTVLEDQPCKLSFETLNSCQIQQLLRPYLCTATHFGRAESIACDIER